MTSDTAREMDMSRKSSNPEKLSRERGPSGTHPTKQHHTRAVSTSVGSQAAEQVSAVPGAMLPPGNQSSACCGGGEAGSERCWEGGVVSWSKRAGRETAAC